MYLKFRSLSPEVNEAVALNGLSLYIFYEIQHLRHSLFEFCAQMPNLPNSGAHTMSKHDVCDDG